MSRLQAYAVDVVTVEEAIQYAQSAAAEAYKEAKEAECLRLRRGGRCRRGLLQRAATAQEPGQHSSLRRRTRRRWCCDAVPVGPRGCGAALRGEDWPSQHTRRCADDGHRHTLVRNSVLPQYMAEVERVTRAAVRDGQVTKLTLSAGHKHNHDDTQAPTTAAVLEASGQQTFAGNGRTVVRLRGGSVSKMRDAEHEVIAAAECVSHTYRAYAGYTVPLSTNLRRLDAAVRAWQVLVHGARARR